MLTETILLAMNKQLREEIDELRETVRQLQQREDKRAILPDGLPHLTRREERALKALWRRRGIVSKETIYADMYGDDGDVNMAIVGVTVHYLRRKLTAAHHPKILTHWGRGFSIDRGAGDRAADAGDAQAYIAESIAA